MSGNNQPNLAGWAAILTAIAAIITAIGFPAFFPDLAKQFFGQDNSNPTITDQNGDLSNSTNPESQNNSEQDQESTNLPEVRANNNDKFVVIDDVKFESLGCQKSSQKIKCAVLATNQAVDRNLEIYTENARIIASGEEYIANYIGIGNIQTSGNYKTSKKLVQNIPIKIFANFDGMQSPLSNIDLLEIVPRRGNSIQIRDIRLSQ